MCRQLPCLFCGFDKDTALTIDVWDLALGIYIWCALMDVLAACMLAVGSEYWLELLYIWLDSQCLITTAYFMGIIMCTTTCNGVLELVLACTMVWGCVSRASGTLSSPHHFQSCCRK